MLLTRAMSTSAHGTEVHICTAMSLGSQPRSYAQTGLLALAGSTSAWVQEFHTVAGGMLSIIAVEV